MDKSSGDGGVGSGNNKKSNVCRYFAANGECFYGEECQFYHQPNATQRPVTSRPVSGNSVINNSSPDSTLSHLPAESKLATYLYQNNDVGVGVAENPISKRKITGGGGGGGGGAGGGGGGGGGALAPGPGSTGLTGLSGNSNTHSLPFGGNVAGSPVNQVQMQVQPQHQQLPAPSPSYFVSDDLKLELLRKQSLLLNPGQNLANGEGLYPEVPSQVDSYQDLAAIEDSVGLQSTTFGFATSVYRGTNVKTGEVLCLRRVHNFQYNTTTTKGLINIIDNWKKLQHSNIVQLRQVFTTKAFGDSSLVFVYDYYPGAQTLNSQYFANKASSGIGGSLNGLANPARPYSQQQQHQRKLLPESLIWTYIIQLSSALRTIHANGLACRAFDPSKIILTNGLLPDPSAVTGLHLQQQQQNQPRLRLSCCAVFDVVTHEAFLKDLQHCNPKVLMAHFQQDDLLALGKVCLALACNSLSVVQRENWTQSLEIVSRHYSADLRSLIFYLLSVKGSTTPRTINDIMPMIGARFYAQLDLSYQRYDLLEGELSKELENGRLFRMLSKLGSINERPELRMDSGWSETGDRYLLKLFRDYLFHQVTEEGQPWLDVGHIVSTLNKLDVASPEKICLVSRDEQNVLIVTFAELKKCLDSAFAELLLQ